MKEKENYIDIESVFLSSGKGNIYGKVINGTEKLLIEKALNKSFGNQSIAAKILGINRNTLRMKIKKMDIEVKKFRI
ncbi:MAG: helix-turn-helix domain-containing protein [Candidatus Omnitrophota bacterium]